MWAPWRLLCRWLRPLPTEKVRISKRGPALVASIVSVNVFSSPLPATSPLTEAVIKLLLRALYGAGS